ncbi:MAG: serine/threonine protein kinase [Planctomycetes bacterium]|nr:serine/threonine protein kinase [Planctomycetota bacterium]
MDTEILLGSLLKQYGYIDNDSLQEILSIQRQLKEKGEDVRLGDILRAKGIIKKRPLDEVLKKQKDLFNTKISLQDYDVLEKIAQGGMGVVYKAKNKNNGHLVAIKVLPPELRENASYVGRFLSEMTTIASLKHPNLVSALDAGDTGKILYYVMEYVDGLSCHQILLKSGIFPEKDIYKVAQQIARAFCYLQDNGLVHRDIKPQNILITRSGEVKLCDLGIAKDIHQKSNETSHTLKGNIIGTPFYMSPEQAAGHKLDIRSDIYSLGVTMYHLAVGKPPFEGNPTEIMVQHVRDKVAPPKKANPNISDTLNNLILWMTEKDPVRRMQSPHQLLLEIDRIQSTHSRPAVATAGLRKYYYAKKRQSNFPIFVSAGAAIATISMVLYLLMHTR